MTMHCRQSGRTATWPRTQMKSCGNLLWLFVSSMFMCAMVISRIQAQVPVKAPLVLKGSDIEYDRLERAFFSSDGDQVATSSWLRNVRVWDANTGIMTYRFPASNEPDVHALLTMDGGYMIVVRPQATELWTAFTWKRCVTLERAVEVDNAICSPDGSRVLTIGKGTDLWQTTTGRHIMHIDDGSSVSAQIAISHDSRFVAIGEYGAIGLWDLRYGVPMAALSDSGPYVSIEFSPSTTTLLAAGLQKKVIVWNGDLWQNVQSLEDQSNLTYAVFSPDGTRIATVGSGVDQQGDHCDGILWNYQTKRRIAVLSSSADWMLYAVFSPDGTTIATAGPKGSVELWDGLTGKRRSGFAKGSADLRFVRFSSDGKRIVVCGSDNIAYVWTL